MASLEPYCESLVRPTPDNPASGSSPIPIAVPSVASPDSAGTSTETTGASDASPDTVAQTLLVAIEKHPGDVNVDVLRLIQKAVSNVQKILSAAGLPPHPELEPELQQEYSKIEPKVKEGTVTKAEAAHLLSLETRAHGHTDKGSLTSVAQSVAARRARKQSVSGSGSQEPRAVQSHNAREENLHKVEMAMLPKIKADPEHVTKEEASLLLRRERQAHGIVEKGSVAAQAQSLADKNINFDHAKDNVAEKHAGEITKDDAALLQSREARVHGNVEAGRATAEVHSLADKNENQAVAAQPPEGIEAFGEGLVRE